MFGAAGLVGGALSGKNKDSTTFLIFYKDGTKQTRTVKNNSLEFNKLVQYVEWYLLYKAIYYLYII